jgi:ACR3 family arsenite efflux pump ArsB
LTYIEKVGMLVGPLIEVPALVALVYVSLALRPRVFPTSTAVDFASSALR